MKRNVTRTIACREEEERGRGEEEEVEVVAHERERESESEGEGGGIGRRGRVARSCGVAGGCRARAPAGTAA